MIKGKNYDYYEGRILKTICWDDIWKIEKIVLHGMIMYRWREKNEWDGNCHMKFEDCLYEMRNQWNKPKRKYVFSGKYKKNNI